MKTAQTTFLALTRRIALILVVFIAPLTAVAHDGMHASRIVSDVGNIVVEGNKISMSVVVSNFAETEVVLLSVFAQNAETSAIIPSVIAPGDQHTVDVSLFFETTIPGIFAVFLDFGEDGQAPALVIN